MSIKIDNLCSAFRTTTSGKDGYVMTFKFRTLEAMHAADDEWHNLRATLSPRPAVGAQTKEEDNGLPSRR